MRGAIHRPGRTKINNSDPSLTSVWTRYAAAPHRARSMLFDPPVELASSGPRGLTRLGSDGRLPGDRLRCTDSDRDPARLSGAYVPLSRKWANAACRAAGHDTIRRVSVETWLAIIGVFVALMALYFSGQSASAAVRPADAAEKQMDIQEYLRIGAAQPPDPTADRKRRPAVDDRKISGISHELETNRART